MDKKAFFDASPFQGANRKSTYFEGWYLRCTHRSDWSFAVIPGISIDAKGERSAFIQLIESDGSSHYIPFSSSEFKASPNQFDVIIGENHFNHERISIDLRPKGLDFCTELTLHPSPLFGEQYHPLNVMGWLSKAPGLPCYHHIIQMGTPATGKVEWKSRTFEILQGRVYIEKDWGTSFPRKWNWLQSLAFQNGSNSLSAVTSSVSLFGLPIPAGMAAYELDGAYYFWSSAWGHSWKAKRADEQLELTFRNPTHRLQLRIESQGQAPLVAPIRGEMKRTIMESLHGIVHIQLRDVYGKLIHTDTAVQAAVEMVS